MGTKCLITLVKTRYKWGQGHRSDPHMDPLALFGFLNWDMYSQSHVCFQMFASSLNGYQRLHSNTIKAHVPISENINLQIIRIAWLALSSNSK